MKRLTVFAAIWLAAACGGSDSDSPSHGSPDAGSDADAAVDVDDASADTESEATVDAETDVADADIDVDDAGADVDLDGGDAGPFCTSCHGGSANAAPPKDVSGSSATSSPGVGAHQSHLVGSGLFRVVECSDCHAVPADGDTSHADGVPAELQWSSVAAASQVVPKYENGQCSVYCHGVTLAGGRLTQPTWTQVDGSQASCGACHGVPPAPPHPTLAKLSCSPCHAGWNGLIPTDPSKHADGKLDVLACGQCHAMPPKTGAHAVHYGDASSPSLASYGDTRSVSDYLPSGAPYYAFGCGNCHPLDPTAHANGYVDVELSNPAAPPGSLKAKSPSSASWSGGKCSDVYCHSSGQASPTYVDTPAWNGGKLPTPRCAACHGNPPKYPSGGAGSATANTHVVMADDGWELGHFGGMPGPWHTSYHGASGEAAAPITCQACHYDTVDPANVGPGGFYYLDTTGDYDLGGGLGYDCTSCHTGQSGAPAVQEGAVLTAKHVNGVRDVVFDPRTSIPSNVTGLPAAPNRPSRPYWVSVSPTTLPPGSAKDGTTWSLTLAGSSYDPTTKACSNVPCHLNQSFGTGKPEYEPLLWGLTPVGWGSCSSCHQL
jgi:predicted CxxxxCH...CXXCH cytochrome family protein